MVVCNKYLLNMKKYINLKSGFIRNKKGLELNWSLYDWSIPFSIDFSCEYLVIVRFLCISLIIQRNITIK